MAEADVAVAQGDEALHPTANGAGDAAIDTSASFADRSHLSYLVPASTNLELEDFFKDVEQGRPVTDSVKQRESLFFGMTRPCSEDQTQRYPHAAMLTSWQMRRSTLCLF